MSVRKKLIIIGILLGVFILPAVVVAQAGEKKLVSVDEFSSTNASLSQLTSPKFGEPTWLTKQKEAEKAALAAKPSTPAAKTSRSFTYSVTTRGAIRANFAEFQTQANQSLNDPRGWARMGVSFKQVQNGGDFILVLSEASQLPSFSPGCSTEYSCRAGQYVIINQDRWLGATPSWNEGGGSLRDYRHMVVNHETGHWLGHDHVYCGGKGQAAPVMQQQSIDLQGCKFNAWPLSNELWTPR